MFRWRSEPRDPYVVLVAEVMLQQTQVWRVEPILEKFLERFPSIAHLAGASRSEVLRTWRGLGYNRRAVYLHECARRIAAHFGGTVPQDPVLLQSLPGIGDYTARAVAAFAYGQDVAVVDVNIQRVLSRLLVPLERESDSLPLPVVRKYADALFPRGGARWWNEALMDIGSLYCVKRSPLCDKCPLRRRCASVGKMKVSVPRTKQEPRYRNVPRRLWRGRLLELVCRHTSLTLAESAAMLFGSVTAEDCSWLETLADRMVRDGVLRRRGNRIELPT